MTQSDITINQRGARYSELLPLDRLTRADCTIVGVGAIGRQVALQLAAMGVGALHLVDFDTVDAVNLGPQGYSPDQIGKNKVDATMADCLRLNPELKCKVSCSKFLRSTPYSDVLFCCVDSIDVRKHVWNLVSNAVMFLGDARMAAESARILCSYDDVSKKHYGTTFFTSENAYAESCTTRSTYYCANVAAGLLVSQYAKWLRDISPPMDVLVNLVSMEMTELVPSLV